MACVHVGVPHARLTVSRTARPAARRLSSRISEYFLDRMMPFAPASNVALTAGVDVIRRRLLFLFASGHVDFDARPDFRPAPRTDAGDGATGLPPHIVGRQAGDRQFVERRFGRVLLQAIGDFGRLFGREVGEERRVDVLDVASHARAAAVVVHHHLQKVGELREHLVVLLRAIERRERVGVPDVPAHRLLRRDVVRLAVHDAVGVAQPFVP